MLALSLLLIRKVVGFLLISLAELLVTAGELLWRVGCWVADLDEDNLEDL